MKIGGKKIDSKPASETVYFKREGGEIIGIRANAVMERTEFEKMVHLPEPPKKIVKGGKKVDDPENPKHLAALRNFSKKFLDWVVIESLCAVEKGTNEELPIEWEIVNRKDPSTWDKWEEELRSCGFSDMERKIIHATVVKVNSLSEQRLDEARESFLLIAEEDQDESSSPTSEQSGTQSGDPVNGLESDHQESQSVGTKLTS